MITKIKQRKKMGIFEKIFFFVFLPAIIVVFLSFLIYSNVKFYQKRMELVSRINSLKKEIQTIEEKNAALKESISQVEDPEYIEKIAREELNQQKPGESVVGFILPPEEEKKEEKTFWDFKKIWEWLKSRF